MKPVREFINELARGDLSQDEMRSEVVKQIVGEAADLSSMSENLIKIRLVLQYRLVKELGDINKNIEALTNVMGSQP